MTLGPIMLDLAGAELAPGDLQRLVNPLVGGVILFTRNYRSPAQARELTAAIRAVKSPAPIIAVDHEGGRVQRFREGFSRLPPMRALGEMHDADPEAAATAARATGLVLAHELRAVGVDLSFTPVLDIDHGESAVIGDRAFHRDPAVIASLAAALIEGLRAGGMASVGKHFPGHGWVKADSHTEIPVDERSLAQIEAKDLEPFRRLVAAGMDAVMPAHVIYPAVDAKPAGFSRRWLTEILRGRLGFSGVIFSDDLSMAGARGEGGVVQRARSALAAGCDMVLVCNDSAGADQLLAGLDVLPPPESAARLARMRGRAPAPGPDYQTARERVSALSESLLATTGADPTALRHG